MRKLSTLFALSISLATIFLLFYPQQASAATKNITPPVDIGSTWYICQGYNSGGSHSGVSRLSLDLTGGPNCDSSASGRSVRAPFAGTVAWYVEPSGSMCINSSNGKSVMLTHIDSLVSRGTVVSTGQQVARVAASGNRQNNGVAHLHLQAWSSTNCSNNENMVPFDSSHTMRMCGAPDLIENGPNSYKSGAWGGTRFTAKSCIDVDKKLDGYIYRFWSDQKQRHFYTADYTEAQQIVDVWPDIWKYEPNGTFKIAAINNKDCSTGLSPVYRFWSDQKQGHFYTASEQEKNQVIDTWPNVWKYERVAFYVGL